MTDAATPTLEIVALHPADAGPAQEGGADRLYLTSRVDPALSDHDGLSVEASLVSATCRETDLPVRPILRLSDSATTTGAELIRLAGLAEDYRAAGADGVVFAFLDSDLLLDLELCTALADAIDGLPWTCHHLIDQTLEPDLVWRQLVGLAESARLDGVHTAGSPRGLREGVDDLIARASRSRHVAALTIAGGGLEAEQVPWLVRAGVRRFTVGRAARPGSSYKAFVDARHVRAWRKLLDEQPVSATGR
ncbi:MAG: copper homeostasis protein CutC [Nocardioidaceae bacterium]